MGSLFLHFSSRSYLIILRQKTKYLSQIIKVYFQWGGYFCTNYNTKLIGDVTIFTYSVVGMRCACFFVY